MYFFVTQILGVNVRKLIVGENETGNILIILSDGVQTGERAQVVVGQVQYRCSEML